jgi:hypothetical protein
MRRRAAELSHEADTTGVVVRRVVLMSHLSIVSREGI